MGIYKFLFGNSYRDRARRDSYRPSVVGKNFISPLNSYGTCFGCEGTGIRAFECRRCSGEGSLSRTCWKCDGEGIIELPAQQCFGCKGSGRRNGMCCERCSGSGDYKLARNVDCKKCSGAGSLAPTNCRKCSGVGIVAVACKRCEGSGWHKFKGGT